ncbi:BRCA2 and CDKN1A-interacting protein isoform X2 [Ambystoma mexicanum]|uniref:BRCA2 and CDKN1A-interacting protein isoform X2 n=1 Tax=Ambystoma mexicanum TaxID=8296 RepID=UPI0037E8D105
MASRPKKPALGEAQQPREEDMDDSGEEDSSEEDMDSEEEINEEVSVDFEAHEITDSDHNGIKKLLHQLFLKAHVNTAELTDILIQQNHIGSVIKGTPCAEQVKELILSQCEKNSTQSIVEQLDKLLNDNSKPVGLLLSERFINVPAQIALPMHQQLQKELAETQRTNKPCGKCYYYLMISKTFKEAAKISSIRVGQQKEELMFANAEDEFFYEQALMKFDYSVQEESDTCLSGRWSFDDVPMKPFRTVMLIPADKMNAIIDKLKEYLSV